MQSDQHEKGLKNIRAAIDRWLQEHAVEAAVTMTPGPQTGGAGFSISSAGKTEAAEFTLREIEDSGEAIDAPAAVKVRLLVSHFVH